MFCQKNTSKKGYLLMRLNDDIFIVKFLKFWENWQWKTFQYVCIGNTLLHWLYLNTSIKFTYSKKIYGG